MATLSPLPVLVEGGATGPDLADPQNSSNQWRLLVFQRREAIFWPRTFNLFINLHSFAGIVARYYRLRLHRRPEPLQVRPSDSFLLPGWEFLVHQLLSGARRDLSCFDPILDGRQNPGGGGEYARSRPPPLPALRISHRLVLAGCCLSLSYTRRMKPSFF